MASVTSEPCPCHSIRSLSDSSGVSQLTTTSGAPSRRANVLSIALTESKPESAADSPSRTAPARGRHVLDQQVACRVEMCRATQADDCRAIGKQRVGQGERKPGWAGHLNGGLVTWATTQPRSTIWPVASAAARRPAAGPRRPDRPPAGRVPPDRPETCNPGTAPATR